MNTTQKTASASAFGVFCILAPAILLVGFGIIDLHFVLRGKTAIATIESSSKEFAGFSNDDVTGTQPTYRYRITYSFDANGTTSAERGRQTHSPRERKQFPSSTSRTPRNDIVS